MRKVDQLGRIVIPSEFRKELGIDSDDELAITIAGGSILLTPLSEQCPECGRPI